MSNKYIYYRESALQSIVSDVTSATVMGALFWFNYTFIGGSYVVNGVILFMMASMMVNRMGGKVKTFTSYKAMLDYLKSEATKEE